MLRVTADVKENDSGLQGAVGDLLELAGLQVLVGIPEEKDSREDGQIGNATLMYIHSNGSPINNIPARPVIEPALENDKERIGQVMGDAVKAAMDNDIDGARKHLERAGMAGQNAARDWFTNPANGFEPLLPETARRKQQRGADIERPLIDTGALRSAITYVVEDKS